MAGAKPSRILLISPSYLMENTIINENVEEKLIRKAIVTASDKYVMPTIGSELYNTLIGMISGGTMSAGPYKTLLDDYVVPMLTEASVMECAPFMMTKFRNKGLQQQTSGENSQPAPFENVQMIMASVRDSYQFYSELLIKYLRANTQLYPEYLNYQSVLNSVAPSKTNQFVGVQFPGMNRNASGEFLYTNPNTPNQ
jgi:hypothetical protein